jgi:hypothetical protein
MLSSNPNSNYQFAALILQMINHQQFPFLIYQVISSFKALFILQAHILLVLKINQKN